MKFEEKKIATQISENERGAGGGGGSKPKSDGTFPKIHPFW